MTIDDIPRIIQESEDAPDSTALVQPSSFNTGLKNMPKDAIAPTLNSTIIKGCTLNAFRIALIIPPSYYKFVISINS